MDLWKPDGCRKNSRKRRKGSSRDGVGQLDGSCRVYGDFATQWIKEVVQVCVRSLWKKSIPRKTRNQTKIEGKPAEFTSHYGKNVAMNDQNI